MPHKGYKQSEEHRASNLGRKHPNRKIYKRGWKEIQKMCLFCNKNFVTNCIMPNKKFCSRSCSGKYNSKNSLISLSKVDREKQKRTASEIRGERHPRWIKDRSKLKDDSKERGGQLHRYWSISVKKRDNWKCKVSNSQCSGRLESHHILSWSSHPESRFDITNGITLCHFHHPRKKDDEFKNIEIYKSLIAN